MKALLVDDSATMRKIHRQVVEELGFHTIVEANDGAEGLDRLNQSASPPDLIICDVNMPRMSGIDFVRHLRELEQTRLTPVVMCTSVAGKSEILQAIKAGANAYVVKPFPPEALRSKILALLAPATSAQEPPA